MTALFPLAVSLPLRPQEVVFKSSDPASSLIELYSSEGCSSCPPAEAWLSHLKNAPGLWKNIFPVAFHVDYWNSLGWTDRFSQPDYSQRQRRYSAQFGQDSVYTPEFIANGAEWHPRSYDDEATPPDGVARSGVLMLNVHAKDRKLAASYVPAVNAPAGPFLLNVAILGMHLVSDVAGGENGGRRLVHDFVVLSFSSAPLTSRSDAGFQSGPLEIKSTTDDPPGAVVAWVSSSDGSIIQIAGGPL